MHLRYKGTYLQFRPIETPKPGDAAAQQQKQTTASLQPQTTLGATVEKEHQNPNNDRTFLLCAEQDISTLR